ncbi:MAG: hypothetical protein KJO98_15840 [Rhodothermia bacterium]|nr:hypothetical protein [Rhodothermia bacterium]
MYNINFRAKRFVIAVLAVQIVALSSCRQTGEEAAKEKDSENSYVQIAIDTTMRDARKAIEEHGFKEPAISVIKNSLADLARINGLRDRQDLQGLHGSTKTEAVVLASDGMNDLTLILARFAPDEPTPVHDHGTWAVLHVLEGRDRYIAWKRVDDGTDPDRARLEKTSEQILHTSDSIHWFGPPHDIHSQVAQDGPAWELILAGSNMLALDRHYFDPATGHVATAKSQLRDEG